jgi:hypothetical protein
MAYQASRCAEGSKAFFQLLPLFEKRTSRREQRLGNRRQHGVADDQFPHLVRKGSRCCWTDPQPKAAQHSAHAHLDAMVLGLQQFARR